MQKKSEMISCNVEKKIDVICRLTTFCQEISPKIHGVLKNTMGFDANTRNAKFFFYVVNQCGAVEAITLILLSSLISRGEI